MRRAAFVVVLGLSLAFVAVSGVARTTQQSHSTKAVKRIERAYRFPHPWRVACKGDCDEQAHQLFLITTKTPRRADEVNVVVTTTLDYSTSPGDSGRAELIFLPSPAPPLPCCRLPLSNPGGFPLSSPLPNVRTTTSVSWVERNVKAAGRRYSFDLEISPRDHTGDGLARVSGKKVTAVIEMWAAG